jgi:hypothetical protein
MQPLSTSKPGNRELENRIVFMGSICPFMRLKETRPFIVSLSLLILILIFLIPYHLYTGLGTGWSLLYKADGAVSYTGRLKEFSRGLIIWN